MHFAADRSKLATAGHEGILRIFDVASPASAPTEVRTRVYSKFFGFLWHGAMKMSCLCGSIAVVVVVVIVAAFIAVVSGVGVVSVNLRPDLVDP